MSTNMDNSINTTYLRNMEECCFSYAEIQLLCFYSNFMVDTIAVKYIIARTYQTI